MNQDNNTEYASEEKNECDFKFENASRTVDDNGSDVDINEIGPIAADNAIDFKSNDSISKVDMNFTVHVDDILPDEQPLVKYMHPKDSMVGSEFAALGFII